MRLTSAEIGYFEDYEDDQVLVVGIAGLDESGARRTFELQRQTYEPEEQDIRYGMDTHCVSNEQGETSYGCLRRVQLEGTAFTLDFHPEDAESFGVEGSVEADLSAADITELGVKLREVLDWGAPDKRPDLRV